MTYIVGSRPVYDFKALRRRVERSVSRAKTSGNGTVSIHMPGVPEHMLIALARTFNVRRGPFGYVEFSPKGAAQ